jgi:hypothetical protein
MNDQFKIITWHGESRSLFYVVDAWASTDEQPYVVRTFHDRADAARWIEALEMLQ